MNVNEFRTFLLCAVSLSHTLDLHQTLHRTLKMKHRFSVKETTVLIVILTLLLVVCKEGKSIWTNKFQRNVSVFNTKIEDYNINMIKHNRECFSL